MASFDVVPIDEVLLRHVIQNLSAEDRAELRAAGIEDDALLVFADGIRRAADSGCVVHGDEPVAVFGVCPHETEPATGIVWMVATPRFAALPQAMARLSAHVVGSWRLRFDTLVNLVHCEHRRAIDWLRWLDFTVLDERTGPGGQFHVFIWRREACARPTH